MSLNVDRSLPPDAAHPSPPPGGGPVPCALLESAMLPVGDRFDVWRESVLPLFESIPDEAPDNFHARVESYDLRHLVMAMSAFSPLRFHRDR
ncbi:hypothetical protein GX586_12680, partial [bacterium]|nr:hypothetical protein [bacterium]